MLSDTDLFICCRKFKNDPFFSKLQYLRNKIGSPTDPIEVVYNASIDFIFAGEAMSGLMGGPDSSEKANKDELTLFFCSKVHLFSNYLLSVKYKNI